MTVVLKWGEKEVVAWDGLWMKGEKFCVASLWEGVRVYVVLCWLLQILQAVLMFGGKRVWLWEWLRCLSSQQQLGGSVQDFWVQVGVDVEVPFSWEIVGVAYLLSKV